MSTIFTAFVLHLLHLYIIIITGSVFLVRRIGQAALLNKRRRVLDIAAVFQSDLILYSNDSLT